MNAKKAREKTLQITGDKERKQFGEIKTKITEAVNKGKFQCFFYDSLIASVKTQLELEGFKVESYNNPRNEILVTISW